MKGTLVAAFFMHLRHDKLFNTLRSSAAFLFLSIFILLTYDDLGVRARSITAYAAEDRASRRGSGRPAASPRRPRRRDEVRGPARRRPREKKE